MNSTENDDYWNESKISTFNFEREDSKVENTWIVEDVTDTSYETRGDSTLFSTSCFNQSVEIETARNYLSESCINCILQSITDKDEAVEFGNRTSLDEEIRLLRRKLKDRWTAPRVEDTINRIFLDQSNSLEFYRSFSEKKKLLQVAVKSADGNAILAVVIHLSRTLKKSLFRQLLFSYPCAVPHYTHYLYTRRQMSEFNETLEVLGKSKDAMMKQLTIAGQNPNRIQQRLSSILKNFNFDPWERHVMENFSQLVEWQVSVSKDSKIKDVIGSSPMQFIENMCLHKLSLNTTLTGTTNKSDSSAEFVAKSLGLSDKQILVIMAYVNTENKKWDAVRNLLISKNWVGGIKLNTNLPMTQILEDLRKNNAPTVLLDDILSCVTDLDKRIELARKLNRHMIVIESINKKKDKTALLKYAATLDAQSAERIYAEKMLDRMDLK